jgi:hypothetical protein
MIMNINSKVISLMNFADSYTVKTRAQLFQNELNWISAKTGRMPSQALFIPYAYKGGNYPGFFRDVADIFSLSGVRLTDITTGDPAGLIAAAEAIVVCGGDITALINKLKSLITPAFNPFNTLKDRINSGIPYIGWNEGSAIISPKYFGAPSTLLSPGINACPFQIITNYKDPSQNRNSVKNYLLTNTFISKAIAMTDVYDGSSVRLEESGSGMIDNATVPYPLVITYKIVNGNLEES